MVRRYETLLLVLGFVVSCRREAPPPAPPVPPPSPPPIAVEALPPPRSATPPAPSGADKAKDKEGTTATREPRAAAELQRPMAKQRGAHAHAAKGKETAGGEIVAAREEVAAAPEAAIDPPVQTTLRFKNAAGANYKLVEARFVMDGAELPTVITSAQSGQTQPVFSGQLPAGHHMVASRLTYQGADRAIFTYMKGYTFHVKSDDEFVARSKNAVNMTIVCKEKTGFNDPVERRLFVTVE